MHCWLFVRGIRRLYDTLGHSLNLQYAIIQWFFKMRQSISSSCGAMCIGSTNKMPGVRQRTWFWYHSYINVTQKAYQISENGDLVTRSCGPMCDVSIPAMYFVLTVIAVHYRISWQDRITFARINGHSDAMQFSEETGFNVHHSVPWCGVFQQESYIPPPPPLNL